MINRQRWGNAYWRVPGGAEIGRYFGLVIEGYRHPDLEGIIVGNSWLDLNLIWLQWWLGTVIMHFYSAYFKILRVCILPYNSYQKEIYVQGSTVSWNMSLPNFSTDWIGASRSPLLVVIPFSRNSTLADYRHDQISPDTFAQCSSIISSTERHVGNFFIVRRS